MATCLLCWSLLHFCYVGLCYTFVVLVLATCLLCWSLQHVHCVGPGYMFVVTVLLCIVPSIHFCLKTDRLESE